MQILRLIDLSNPTGSKVLGTAASTVAAGLCSSGGACSAVDAAAASRGEGSINIGNSMVVGILSIHLRLLRSSTCKSATEQSYSRGVGEDCQVVVDSKTEAFAARQARLQYMIGSESPGYQQRCQ